MNYEWKLVTDDMRLTDDMGNLIVATPTQRRVNFNYKDTGEIVPLLNRTQTVYADFKEHDILVGADHMYIRERYTNYFYA